MLRVATDVGGTFTDFIAFDETAGKMHTAKSSTTPNIIDGIVECFRKSRTPVSQVEHFIHGSTVAINTVIERKGARTGLLATEGFKHILDLGRGNIKNSFDLMFHTPEALVPPFLRRGIRERMLSSGEIFRELDQAHAIDSIDDLVRNKVESIAVCLLHSYANPQHELKLKELIQNGCPQLYATVSSDIIRQYREYERTSTTVLNAYIGPRVDAYLNELRLFLAAQNFNGGAMIMQSNGGTMTIDTARAQPVRMMESGPVGGTMAAAHLGKLLGYDNVVAFDMGGTTAKVSIVKQGKMDVADGYFIGGEEIGYPLQLPVVDIIEIGAGGGSIAYLDETGALKVGPTSAGASPGPACYSLGGVSPTVTDADLVLGRLNPNYFLGGEIALSRENALHAINLHVGKPLELDPVEAARGIVKIADISMAHALRTMIVQRGYDPRESVMIAYGGAGPLHAVSLARELSIRKVVIPPYCGIFSALGMLLADAKDEYVLSHIRPFKEPAVAEIDRLFRVLEGQGLPLMARRGFPNERIVVSRALEMRYLGQEFTLLIDCPKKELTSGDIDEIRLRFNEVYEARYGHAFPEVVPEVVSLRLQVCGIFPKPEFVFRAVVVGTDSLEPTEYRDVSFEDIGFARCAIYRRSDLPANVTIQGPAVIEEDASTTIVFPGDEVRVDRFGNLIIAIGDATGKQV